MRVLQVLPELNAGGVERGTLDLARGLVNAGHESLVMSNGGRLVSRLEAEGSRHLTCPVHRKSPASFAQIRPVRRLLRELEPDIVHVRSRMPAWIVWLAWRKMDPATRPRLVSTFHGLYSVNRYSAIMARAEKLIAVSHCVQRYILYNYPVEPERITVIHRGVDTDTFSPGPVDESWREQLYGEMPELAGKHIILMPGRLSRWKGQSTFLDVMARLVQERDDCHGVIVGDAEPNKAHYRQELESRVTTLDLGDHVSFAGHRNDIQHFYRLARVVCHLSAKPEPFGRTLTEALACGTPVVAFDRGGAAESLSACFPAGLVPADDLGIFTRRVLQMLESPSTISIAPGFTLPHQIDATLGVYKELLRQERHP